MTWGETSLIGARTGTPLYPTELSLIHRGQLKAFQINLALVLPLSMCHESRLGTGQLRLVGVPFAPSSTTAAGTLRLAFASCLLKLNKLGDSPTRNCAVTGPETLILVIGSIPS
jgi:hypothetical protein